MQTRQYFKLLTYTNFAFSKFEIYKEFECGVLLDLTDTISILWKSRVITVTYDICLWGSLGSHTLMFVTSPLWNNVFFCFGFSFHNEIA